MSKSIRLYSFDIPSELDSKMTPQIKQILGGISESGNSEFQESELKTLISELAESGKLKLVRILGEFSNIIVRT